MFPAAKKRLSSINIQSVNFQVAPGLTCINSVVFESLEKRCVCYNLILASHAQLTQMIRETTRLNEKVAKLQEHLLKTNQAKEIA